MVGTGISHYYLFYLYLPQFIDLLLRIYVRTADYSSLLSVRGGIVIIIGRLITVEPGVKRHLGALVLSSLLLSQSLSFFFDRYGLFTHRAWRAARGILCRRRVRIWALSLMVALSVAAAVAIALFASRRSVMVSPRFNLRGHRCLSSMSWKLRLNLPRTLKSHQTKLC